MDNLDNRFAYHKPTSDYIAGLHEAVRASTGDLAKFFDRVLPDGREKSLAITNLEQAMMWANAAIARDQEGTVARA